VSEEDRIVTELNKGPAYRIETDRLVLRAFEPLDAVAWRSLLDDSDAHLRPWIPWMNRQPMTLQQTAQWLRTMRAEFDGDQNYRYAILDRDESTLIGMSVLLTRSGPGSLEAGYMVAEGHGGRGYASEATKSTIRVAFEVHEVDRVDIVCAPEYVPSLKIPERLGFTHEATLRRRGLDSEGRISDNVIWSLFADEYPDTSSASLPVSAFGCIGERLL